MATMYKVHVKMHKWPGRGLDPHLAEVFAWQNRQ